MAGILDDPVKGVIMLLRVTKAGTLVTEEIQSRQQI